ncbi:hypothetical protein HF086_002880 [Spodoptera exigua]|uniref:Uncharacterized protein n=1 Tax=Spodoptera exigua TaxID=7107 RepID=A0A922M8I8_SPOEX|nr:hypothetical protein HF086_002880 [Spodoptera exigua]
MFDEMSIKKHFQYNPKDDIIEGYEYHGTHARSAEDPEEIRQRQAEGVGLIEFCDDPNFHHQIELRREDVASRQSISSRAGSPTGSAAPATTAGSASSTATQTNATGRFGLRSTTTSSSTKSGAPSTIWKGKK